MKKILVPLLYLLILSGSVFGQKYKDIFPVLDAKNYQEGEPLLRQFLSNAKNLDHPNANLQMAMLLEKKTENLDVIEDSTSMIRYSDSIRTYYTHAKNFIDEKELKKRDEYYKAYYRRDMRTGTFTIKKSDVDADIEKKLDHYASVKEGVKFLAANLPRLENSMKTSLQLYESLTSGFSSFEGIALAVNEETLESLSQLREQNLKTQDIVNTIQEKIASLPELGFNSDEDLEPVQDVNSDGLKIKSPYEGSFIIWDYASFVEEIVRIYEEEVLEYRKMLLAENDKFEKMLKTIKSGLIPAQSPAVSQDLLTKTETLDETNIAMSILQYKSALVKYRLIDFNLTDDPTDIYRMLDKYDTLNKVVDLAAVHFEDFSSMNTELEKKKYNGFLRKALGRVSLLDQYIRDQEVWVKNRKHFIGTKTGELKETVRWGISPSDSVALFTEAEGQLADRLTNYVIADTVNYVVAAGFDTKAIPFTVFIGRVDPGMNLLWKYEAPSSQQVLDSLAGREFFKLVPGKPELVTLYFSEDPATYHFTAFNKRSGKLQWKAKINTKKPVFDVRYNEDTKETIVWLDDPDTVDDAAYNVIDKYGKVRK